MNIELLPNEIILKILQKLDQLDLVRNKRVNNRWYSVIDYIKSQSEIDFIDFCVGKLYLHYDEMKKETNKDILRIGTYFVRNGESERYIKNEWRNVKKCSLDKCLSIIARTNNLKAIKILCNEFKHNQLNAKYNKATINIKRVILLAATHGNFDVVEYLIKDYDLHELGDIICDIAKYGNIKLLKYFVDNTNIVAILFHLHNALLTSVKYNQMEILKYLLDLPRVTARYKYSKSLLISLRNENFMMADMLLNQKHNNFGNPSANINDRFDQLMTNAIHKNKHNIVKYLLKACDGNYNFKTYIQLASEINNCDIICLLCESVTTFLDSSFKIDIDNAVKITVNLADSYQKLNISRDIDKLNLDDNLSDDLDDDLDDFMDN